MACSDSLGPFSSTRSTFDSGRVHPRPTSAPVTKRHFMLQAHVNQPARSGSPAPGMPSRPSELHRAPTPWRADARSPPDPPHRGRTAPARSHNSARDRNTRRRSQSCRLLSFGLLLELQAQCFGPTADRIAVADAFLVELDIGDSSKDLLKRDTDFVESEVGSQAPMDSRTECHVTVLLDGTVQDELVGAGKHCAISVTRAIEEHDSVALTDQVTANLHI